MTGFTVNVSAQNRLDPEPEPGEGGNETVDGVRGFAEEVIVCFSDNFLYGFCSPVTDRSKRLGNIFSVYLAPTNGSVGVRVVVDEVPLEFSNGNTTIEVSEPLEHEFTIPNLRRAELVVELVRGNQTQFLEYGNIRFRDMAGVMDDARDDKVTDIIEEEIRKFTPAQWALFNIKLHGVVILALIIALYAGVQKGREEEQHEEPTTIGF